jgi:ABC-type glycerol-3-phosphate transport system substrate-binding protein
MKKFVLFVAMFAVCTFALAACGSKKAEEATVAEVVEEEVITPEATETSK